MDRPATFMIAEPIYFAANQGSASVKCFNRDQSVGLPSRYDDSDTLVIWGKYRNRSLPTLASAARFGDSRAGDGRWSCGGSVRSRREGFTQSYNNGA
jgi:hypothetical protein